jgi:hypothetical protein
LASGRALLAGYDIRTARAAAASGRYEQALAHASRATAVYPVLPVCSVTAARICLAAGRHGLAVRTLLAGREHSSNTYPFDLYLGEAYLLLAARGPTRREFLGEARSRYRQALATRPEAARPRERLRIVDRLLRRRS